MYQTRLTYCPTDRGFYVYLLQYETVIDEKFFTTEQEARDFMKKVTKVSQ